MGPNTAAGAAPVRPGRRGAARLGALTLHGLDLAIALGRKVGGFCALLTLGWTYLRLFLHGGNLTRLYPGAPDPDLRQTLWVALLLVMAQGWDIPTDAIAAHWRALRGALPARPPTMRRRAPPRPGFAGPVVVHLGRFMDLCVAVANKLGAFAVLVYLVVLAGQFALAGANVRAMYPRAADPTVSFLADLSVYVVVLGWWATPFEQIATFWHRLRGTGGRDAPGRGVSRS